jgi:PAS domain S-box-containing protein
VADLGAHESGMGVRAGLDESAEDLYDNAPCGYLSTTPDGTIVRVNATFLRWTGYRRDELVETKRFRDLLTAGGRVYHETHYAPLLMMQGGAKEIALDIVRADGSRLPALITSQLKLDADGAPRLVRTTVFEATDRKRYEQELLTARNRERVARERVERLQLITAAIADAPHADAIVAALTRELIDYLGARRGGIVLADSEPADRARASEFDEGDQGRRDASVQIRLAGPPGTNRRLWMEFDDVHRFEEDERVFIRVCAEQAALALERVRLFELQRDVSRTLQHSLLSGEPLIDPRYEVATAYHPAGEHLEVGGDWYDAVALPDDRLAVVVGDVVGRGITAASAMGQLRSATRALAGAGFGPAAVLEHLDTFVEQSEAARYATVAYADVDPATGRVRFATAGHLPPLLLKPGRGPEYFAGARSTPLGIVAGDGRRPETTFDLEPGGGFLLYTDGLVERRTEVIDAGLARLVSAVQAMCDASPAQLVDYLPGALLDQHAAHDDDVCLLSFRRVASRRQPEPARESGGASALSDTRAG